MIVSSWHIDERGIPRQIGGEPVPPTCAACHDRGHDVQHCEAVHRDELPMRAVVNRVRRTDEQLQADATRAIVTAAPIRKDRLARLIGGDYTRACAAIEACIADGRIAWSGERGLRRLVHGDKP